MTVTKWDRSKISAAKKILKKYETLSEALPEISRAIKLPITCNSVEKAFKRYEQPSPHSFVKARPLNPIEAQEKREQESAERQHVDAIVAEVRELRARQAFLDKIHMRHGPPKILPREKGSGLRELTAVVLASDWHVEEPVDPVSIAYRNEYNLEIAERRIGKFFEAVIWNVEHHRADGHLQIRDLVLWLGGDLMSGYIHEELLEGNLLSPTETVVWLIPILRNGILTLLERLKLESITIPCSFGNHGRTSAKPRISTAYANSYEWLMYHALADSMRTDSRVRFEITNSAHQYTEVYGRVIHMHHGDDVKYSGGVGGLGIPLLKAVPMWDLVKKADVHCIGHWHQLRDYGRAVVNGSLIGYNAFAQRIRAEFEPPQQVMFFMDSARGKCLLTNLWVDSSEENARQCAGGAR